jgi:hypothetical protein
MNFTTSQITDIYLAQAERYAAGLDSRAPKISGDLLERLGCPFILRENGQLTTSLNGDLNARTYLPSVLVAAVSVSVSALGDDTETTSLLAGIGRAKCWRECIATIGGAYSFAIALVKHIELLWTTSRLDVYVDADVMQAMNGWLELKDPWSDFPSAYMLCQHLFGNAWCDLALPESARNIPGSGDVIAERACRIISEQRPPFLPGMCPAQAEPVSVPLPDNLGVPS